MQGKGCFETCKPWDLAAFSSGAMCHYCLACRHSSSTLRAGRPAQSATVPRFGVTPRHVARRKIRPRALHKPSGVFTIAKILAVGLACIAVACSSSSRTLCEANCGMGAQCTRNMQRATNTVGAPGVATSTHVNFPRNFLVECRPVRETVPKNLDAS